MQLDGDILRFDSDTERIAFETAIGGVEGGNWFLQRTWGKMLQLLKSGTDQERSEFQPVIEWMMEAVGVLQTRTNAAWNQMKERFGLEQGDQLQHDWGSDVVKIIRGQRQA